MDFTDQVLHGDNVGMIDEVVAPDYIQHTHGAGQGPQGLKNYIEKIASKRPGRKVWRPVHSFAAGDFVILHKVTPLVSIVDIVRFNASDKLQEHWDIVQPLPKPDFDPMELSSEDFTRFYKLFNIPA